MPLTRLIIKNYKSIKDCDISLSDLNVLIGGNGTGKTNLLDAISYFYRNLTETNPSNMVFDENNHYSNELRITLVYDLSEFPIRTDCALLLILRWRNAPLIWTNFSI